MALYIDVEPVIKQLTATVVTDDSIGMGIQMGLNRAMEILAKAPIVEAEPVVHAHWDSQNRCSNCCVPAISHDIDEEVEAFYLTKRCPYCGAHMDEEVAE